MSCVIVSIRGNICLSVWAFHPLTDVGPWRPRRLRWSLAPLSVFHEVTSGQMETNRDRAGQSEAKDTQVWPMKGQKEIWTMRWVLLMNVPGACHCHSVLVLVNSLVLKASIKGREFNNHIPIQVYWQHDFTITIFNLIVHLSQFQSPNPTTRDSICDFRL